MNAMVKKTNIEIIEEIGRLSQYVNEDSICKTEEVKTNEQDDLNQELVTSTEVVEGSRLPFMIESTRKAAETVIVPNRVKPVENHDNHTVHITIFENFYDNRAGFSSDISWKEFKELLSEHTIESEKTNITSFNCWRFKENDFEPARREKMGQLHLDDNGQPTPARTADNCTEISALFLDFDGGMSIRDGIKLCKKFEHFGYTSSGHKKKKSGYVDKFRMVLPFEKPISKDDFLKIRDSIKEWAVGLDKKSVDISRLFAGYACDEDHSVFAETWSNKGRLLRFEDFKSKNIGFIQFRNLLMQKMRAAERKEHDGQYEQLRGILLRKLTNHFVGYEPTWNMVAVAMYNEGFSLQDFTDVTVGGMMNSKTVEHCEAKWSRAQTSNLTCDKGYLWNVTKGKHDR